MALALLTVGALASSPAQASEISASATPVFPATVTVSTYTLDFGGTAR